MPHQVGHQSGDPWEAPDPALALAHQHAGWWVAFATAWAELQVAINEYRLIPADKRDGQAQRDLVSKVNEVISADTGRWASRRRSLAAGRT